MSSIPPHIVETINTLLAPYGEHYTPGTSSPGRYMNYREAAKYTGLSISTLRRAVAAGTLKAPFRPNADGGKHTAALFAVSQLDAFVQQS
jgi:excisionase family DNA binding protein